MSNNKLYAKHLSNLYRKRAKLDARITFLEDLLLCESDSNYFVFTVCDKVGKVLYSVTTNKKKGDLYDDKVDYC